MTGVEEIVRAEIVATAAEDADTDLCAIVQAEIDQIGWEDGR